MKEPNLTDWSLVQNAIRATRDQFEYETRSQSLAHLLLYSLFGSAEEDIVDDITDGTDDRGVDAVVIREEASGKKVHIFQVKCVESFNKSGNNFPSSEIDKLLSFTDDLLKRRLNERSVNPLLWGKAQEIWAILDRETPSFTVHLAGNLGRLKEEQEERLVESLAPYRYFDIYQHSLATVADLLVESKRPKIDGQLRLVDNQYFERVDGNIRGLIATIEAEQLVNLIQDPSDPDRVLQGIFDENVRVYLTGRNRFNQRIIESALAESNSQFWYLNNGVTLTCDSMDYPPGVRGPRLTLRNVQIVNGGQTSNALFESWQQDPERVRNVLLLVRVYETKTPEINVRIAETTNSQTPIRSRDLRANDEIQRKLEEAFLAKGLFYERKANQHKDKEKRLRIDALEAAQAYVAFHQSEPLVAAKDRGKIFGDLYDSVFTDDLTAELLLASTEAFKPIAEAKKALQKAIRGGRDYDVDDLFLIDGGYHFLFCIAYLAESAGVSLLDVGEVLQHTSDAKRVVRKAVAREQEDPAFAHKRFFKSTRAKRYIEEEASRLIGVRSSRSSMTDSPR